MMGCLCSKDKKEDHQKEFIADTPEETTKMGDVRQLATKEDFDNFLKANGDTLLVIDFYADWCGPCKMIAPKIKAMAAEFTDVIFAKVNVDDNEEAAAESDITAMPTFQFFKAGKKVDEITGANETKIREFVQKYR